jgi:hypothetical protein
VNPDREGSDRPFRPFSKEGNNWNYRFHHWRQERLDGREEEEESVIFKGGGHMNSITFYQMDDWKLHTAQWHGLVLGMNPISL